MAHKNNKSKANKTANKFFDATTAQQQEFIQNNTNAEKIEKIYTILIDLINDNTISNKSKLKYEKILENMMSFVKSNTVYNPYSLDNSGFIPKPDIRDKKFSWKLFNKKEFNLYKSQDILANAIKYHGDNEDLETLIEYEVKHISNEMRLSKNQQFLKRFINNNSPYKSILLFHGTGVGKTCSAVSIAEGFADDLEHIGKKIYVLLNPSIQPSFKKNIFNMQRLEDNMVESQCTRDKYLKNKTITKDNIEKIKNEIRRKIRNRYEFLGYREFANKIMKEDINIRKKRQDISEEEKTKIINNRIKMYFSNSVLIIDEAHNIKEGSAKEKNFTKILHQILEVSENMKLILLSATPMFNEANEITYLINLLLRNEKRPLIEDNIIFDKSGNVKSEGIPYLMFKSRGLVSYIRGNNPVTFPAKLYPKKTMETFPIYTDISRTLKIKDENKITDLKLVGTHLRAEQKKAYIETSKNNGSDSFDTDIIGVSNILFPDNGNKLNITDRIGNTGFNHSFDTKINGRHKLKITPKKHIGPDISFLNDKIKDYSTKFSKILNNISKSNGIVFIYSKFKWSGVISMAIALEMRGYHNFDNGNLLNNNNKKKIGTYLLLSAEPGIKNDNLYEDYMKIENTNKNGEKVKIILGTGTAAEGLDFKYIREVHILEPWFHLSKNDQVEGRAIRYGSHLKLPFKERNVTVYQYASILKGPYHDVETIDLKLYREAERKDKNIAKIQYEIKKNAVDCNLNYSLNVFKDIPLKKEIAITDSKGRQRIIKMGDYDNDYKRECQYNKCDFVCADGRTNDELKPGELDISTFSLPVDIEDYIYDIKKKLISYFVEKGAYTIEDLLKKREIRELNLEPEFIYFSLDNLIQNKTPIKGLFGEMSKIVYKGNLYVLEPISLSNMKPTLQEIRTKPHNKDKFPTQIDITSHLRDIGFIGHKEKEQKRTLEIQNLRKIIDNKEIDISIPLLLTYDMKTIENLCKKAITNKPENIELYNNLQTLNFITTFKNNGKNITGFSLIKNNKIVLHVSEGDTFKEHTEGKLIDAAQIEWHKKNKINGHQLIVGFYKMKNNNPIFKIKDNRTNDGEKNKTKIKTGSVCNNDGMKKGKLIEFLNILEKKEYNPKLKKIDLCNMIQTKMLQMNEGDKRWFFSLIDSYMMHL
jgi:hypothetical protein